MSAMMKTVRFVPRPGPWLIGLGAVFFGFTGVTSRTLYARSDITSLGVGWLRVLVAAFALSALALRRARALPRPRSYGDWFALLGLGVSMAAYQVTFFGGVERSTIINVTLITVCTAPVIVAALAPLFLKERPTLATLGALLCAIAGTALLVQGGGRISLSAEHLSGNLLALGAAASYASFVLISKRALDWLDSFAIIAITFCVATLLLTPLALGDVLAAGLTWGDWPYILWLGLGSAALAYSLYILGLPYASATAASVATLMEPLTATILAAIFFQERLGAIGLAGAALLIAGMALLFRRGT